MNQKNQNIMTNNTSKNKKFCRLTHYLWKFGPPYLGNVTAAARAALPSPTSACVSFHVSVIHWTLTWTTESLTYVRDNSYTCVYTWGLGTSATNHHIFYLEKLSHIFLAQVFGSEVRCCTTLHPITCEFSLFFSCSGTLNFTFSLQRERWKGWD